VGARDRCGPCGQAATAAELGPADRALLPAKPNNGGDDTLGQLGALVDADGGAGRLLAATIRS
jgi:hypothetical protein